MPACFKNRAKQDSAQNSISRSSLQSKPGNTEQRDEPFILPYRRWDWLGWILVAVHPTFKSSLNRMLLSSNSAQWTESQILFGLERERYYQKELQGCGSGTWNKSQTDLATTEIWAQNKNNFLIYPSFETLEVSRQLYSSNRWSVL